MDMRVVFQHKYLAHTGPPPHVYGVQYWHVYECHVWGPCITLTVMCMGGFEVWNFRGHEGGQWRRKIVEFRGAEAKRHTALPCFSPANFELFIATNSPDNSLLLLSWVHSDSLPSDSDKLSTSTLLSILHLFASLTCKERCNRYLWSNYSTNRVKLFKLC